MAAPCASPAIEPARDAFAMGRLMVVASRAESLPYVVLEAAAAGVPMIATRVGGIPEIFGPTAEPALVAPGDPHALADAIARALDDRRPVARSMPPRCANGCGSLLPGRDG